MSTEIVHTDGHSNSLAKIKVMFHLTHPKWLIEFGQTENGMTFCTVSSPGSEINDFSPERVVMGLVMSELSRMMTILRDRSQDDWKDIYLHHINTMFSRTMDKNSKSLVDYVYEEMFLPVQKSTIELEAKLLKSAKQLTIPL